MRVPDFAYRTSSEMVVAAGEGGDKTVLLRAIRIESGTATVPPGGGACWWCSGRLYRRNHRWSYAVIVDGGHERGVHISDCGGPDALDRPKGALEVAP